LAQLADSPHIHSRVLLTNCDELPAVLNERQGFFCIRGSDLDRLEAGDFRAIEAWLYETLQLGIISVIESLNQLRESPDYELCQLSGQKAGVLDELASERATLLEQESAELEKQAERLAAEIKELNGQSAVGIS